MGRNTKLRIITGTVYFLVLIAFFCMKILIRIDGKDFGKLFFDGLILLFGIFGTYEMLHAFGEKLHITQKVVVMTFALLTLVIYIVSDFLFTEIYGVKLPDEDGVLHAVGRNYAPYFMLVAFVAGFSLIMGMLVFAHRYVTLESTGYALMSYLYPTVFLIVFVVCNHLQVYSDIAIAFVFGIAPCADVMALVFGKTFGKKLPAKMAPNISPNKTLIGGAGGLLGGAIGGFCVFLVYYGVCRPVTLGTFDSVIFVWSDLWFFCAIGVVASAFAQFGDLVESGIKRKLGIKDMGNILPGHGGVLDRIDSSLYASLIIALILIVRLMLFT